MLLGKDATGNPVISVESGQTIGKIRDLFLDTDAKKLTGIYLGTEGLFSRTSHLVQVKDIVVIGPDAVLVKNADVILEASELDEYEMWLRRDELQGRNVDTPGGTKVGRVGDIIINESGEVIGYSLDRVYVAGPIAENGAIAMHAVQDTGTTDGVMTVNLEDAENQSLSVTGNGQMGFA